MTDQMSGQLPSEWELGSGLKDNYTFVVDHSYFGYDAQYQDGKQLLLIWEGHDAEDDSPVTEKYSIGKGWNTPDLGRSITGMKNVNKNSMYGKIIEWAISDKNLLNILLSRGTPMISAIWEGLAFQMRVQEIKFGKNLDPIERVMPVAFIGDKVDTSTPVATTARGVASTPTPAPSAAPTAETNGVIPGSPATGKILTRMAAKASDFESFVSEALDIPEVMENVELRNLVSDDSDSGFFATHHA